MAVNHPPELLAIEDGSITVPSHGMNCQLLALLNFLRDERRHNWMDAARMTAQRLLGAFWNTAKHIAAHKYHLPLQVPPPTLERISGAMVLRGIMIDSKCICLASGCKGTIVLSLLRWSVVSKLSRLHRVSQFLFRLLSTVSISISARRRRVFLFRTFWQMGGTVMRLGLASYAGPMYGRFQNRALLHSR